MAYTVKPDLEAPVTADTKDEVKLLFTRTFLDDPEAEMNTENAHWEGDDFVVDGEVIAEVRAMENTYEAWAFAQGYKSAKRGDPAPEKDQCDPHFWAGFTEGQR